MTIREFRKDLPIIAQTAYILENEIERYADNTFDDYITKPFDEQKLKQIINRYLSA